MFKEPAGYEIVYKTWGMNEAIIVRGLLKAAGLECILNPDAVTSARAYMGDESNEVVVLVAAEDADEARSILESSGDVFSDEPPPDSKSDGKTE